MGGKGSGRRPRPVGLRPIVAPTDPAKVSDATSRREMLEAVRDRLAGVIDSEDCPRSNLDRLVRQLDATYQELARLDADRPELSVVASTADEKLR